MATTVSKVVETAARYCMLLVLSRALGVHRFGLFALAMTVTHVFAIFCRLGLNHGALRFVAEYRATGKPERIRALTRLVWRAVPVASALCLMLVFGATATFVRSSDYGAALSGPRVWVVLSLPFMAITPVLIAILRGAGRVTQGAIIEGFVQPLLCLGLIATMALLHQDGVLAFCFLLSWMLSCLLAWRGISRLPEMQPVAHEIEAHCAEVLPFSLVMLGISTIDVLTMSVDTLLVGHFRGGAEAGYYVAAQRTAVGLTLILFACNYAFAPVVPQYLQEGSRDKLEHLYRTVTKWVLMFSSPVAIIVLLCPELVLGFFGPGFAVGARNALVILTISQWLNIATGPGGYLLLMMSGNHRLMAVNSALALLTCVPLHLVLIPRYGATGAALATAFATSAVMLVILAQVWWKLRLFPYDARLLGTVIGVIACASSLHFALALLPVWTAVIGALTVYVVILCAFGLDGDDRDAWQSLTRAASGRLRATLR